jgi:RNA polymerase sigma factor (sigma-70 family)
VGRPRIGVRDRAWMARIVARDESAIGELYDAYSAPCHALAGRILVDPQLAQDVVQEVFLAIWRQPERYDPDKATVSTFLLSMTHHKAVDSVRREENQRRRRIPGDVLSEPIAGMPAADAPDDEVWIRLEQERVRGALADIPEAQREALVLAYYGGYTQTEIAGITNTPLGTVKTRMLAGMRKLNDLLGPKLNSGGDDR